MLCLGDAHFFENAGDERIKAFTRNREGSVYICFYAYAESRVETGPQGFGVANRHYYLRGQRMFPKLGILVGWQRHICRERLLEQADAHFCIFGLGGD